MSDDNKTKKGAEIDKNNARYRDYLMKKAAIVKIVAFSVMLIIGATLSLIIPLRPKVSVSENRNLTEFPQFKLESFMDGTYFSSVDKWFSDTFPFRDQLLTCNDKVTYLYGLRSTVVHGEIVAGDEIPDVDVDVEGLMRPSTRPEKETATENSTDMDSSKETETNEPGSSQETTVAGSEGNSENNSQSNTQAPTGAESETGSQVVGERFGSIFVYGDSAYEYFVYSQKNSDTYVELVNNLAAAVSDKAAFYSIIIPNSMDIMLDDSVRSSVSTSDQRKAILYLCSKMSDKVNKTFVFDMLKSRNNEYLYFRSDHHWTALAAYYTYCALASQMGITPNSLDSYKKMEFANFQGSFYSSTKVESLITKPDSVTAYVPMATNALKYHNLKGQTISYKIIADVSNFQPRNKYSAFIGGDNPYTEIENPNLKDGSSCLVIKESYGNALVPFLVDHFQYVYVVDYRHYTGTVTELVNKKNIQNVIMINNVVATSGSGPVADMKKVCK